MKFLTLLLAANIFAVPYFQDWWNTPGEWEVPYEVNGWPGTVFGDYCLTASICTSFMATIQTHKPSCLRYLNPKVIHDDREIPGHVTEIGTPGEADWEWTFQTDEIFTGPFIWKVTTINLCPEVG
jgi:hypothetical protein